MGITQAKFIEALNDYPFNNNPKEIIDILNVLIDDGSYKDFLDLVFIAISSTQLYGFLTYLTPEEQSKFFECDFFRANSYRGNKIDFYNKGQLSFLLELEQYSKVFFSAPTSFGKTGIIIEYILNNYNKLNNIVFVVPTNSLIEELFCKFLEYNVKLRMRFNVSIQPVLQEGKNILFLTPERFMLIEEENKLSNFDLIVMDETYKIVDSHNERVSDFINSRAVRFRKVADIIGACNKKVVFLSPFTYSLTDSMQRFLDKYDIKKINRRLEYVKREIVMLNNAKTVKRYFNDNKIRGYTKNTTLTEKSKFLLKKLKNEKNIVYVSNYSKAYGIIDEIDFSCKRDDIEKVRFDAFLNHLKENYAIEGEAKWKVIDALERGIGIYISPIPRYIKRELINLYEKGAINTLVVTTSFTEGVNTSASNLIFTSLVNGPTTNKLSDIDILNVAGRVGRFSSKSVGHVFCITDELYTRVNKLQMNQDVKLENYNYCHVKDRIDYEIEMIDEKYLSTGDKAKKSDIGKDIKRIGLDLSDLNISLNVSNSWKILLYKYFSGLSKEKLTSINQNIESIYLLEEGTRINALDYIFKDLQTAFNQYKTEGFPQEKYEIHPFDNTKEFIWGRLYKIYLAGSIKKVISSNINFITTKYNTVIKNSNYTRKSDVENIFEKENLKWLLRYYDTNLNVNFNAFYSETFKFISNIVQYKIPFYLSFYVSIFKLFISKNDISIPSDKGFDIKELINIFEEGNFEKEYKCLVDYGLPMMLLEKLSINKITLKSLKNKTFNNKVIDEYENIIISDAMKYIGN